MSVRTIRGNGRYQVAAFGASGKDADESNAVQLGSTAHLAIPKPGKVLTKFKE